MAFRAWKLLILLYLDVITAENECNSKWIPNTESPVCVCNASYCDTIPPVKKVSNLQYVVYTTSKSGHRLKKDVLSFTDSNWKNIGSTVIKINTAKKYQTIIGWGGAVTDAAGIDIKSLNMSTQELLVRSYFADEGLQYNLIRVPIGGTDFSVRHYTYDDGEEDRNLTHFSLAKEDLEYKIPVLQLAQNNTNNTLQLLGAAWFAPDWMQSPNKSKSIQGYIEKSMYQTWADYHLKFLKSYQEYGFNFWAISTGNEPVSASILNFVPVFVKWTAKSMGIWVGSNLGPTLQNSEFSNVQILTLDDWRSNMPWFVDEVFSNKDAKKYVQGIAVHWYEDDRYSPYRLDATHYKHPDKFILYTEACKMKNISGIHYGSWKFAEDYAADILQDLNHWSTGWMDWNIALNMEGGPTYIHNEVNSPIFIDASKGEFYKQPMYYILGHFSKFIPQGSKRIKHKCINRHLSVVALKRPDGGIVIVILNKNDKKIPVTINVEKGKHINLNTIGKSISTILYW